MVSKLRLTKTSVADIPFTDGKRFYIQDSDVDHLYVRVGKRTKTFVLRDRLHGKQRWFDLGDATAENPEAVRKRARAMLGDLARGLDPTAEKLPLGGPTLRQAWERFRANRKLKPKTVIDYGRRLDVYFEDWLDRPLATISGNDIAAKYRDSPKKQYASGCMRVFRSIYNFARADYRAPDGEKTLPENPVLRLSETKTWERARRRKTSIRFSDLPAWLEGIAAYPTADDHLTSQEHRQLVADFLRIVVFTGLRKDEARLLRWSYIDLSDRTLTIPNEISKNEDAHVLPLSDPIYEILRRRSETKHEVWVFPGEPNDQGEVLPFDGYWKHIWKIEKKTGIKHSIHDLRRTFTTVAESLDLSAYTLKRLLNHRIEGDVTGGYIMRDVDRLRQPMQRIAQRMMPEPATDTTTHP